MANLTQYVHDNFDVSKSTLDLIDNICYYVLAQPEYVDGEGRITEEGCMFISGLLDGVADMWYDEIREAWRYQG